MCYFRYKSRSILNDISCLLGGKKKDSPLFIFLNSQEDIPTECAQFCAHLCSPTIDAPSSFSSSFIAQISQVSVCV